jgi:putative membrane protein
MTDARGSDLYLGILGALFGALWLALAIAPLDRATWALENVLVVAGVGLLVGGRRRLGLSRLSHGSIFVFLCLHAVGAHYTYSLTPYDEWFRALTGRSLDAALGWERNHFDRAVHFAYGLLLALPMREFLQRELRVSGFWSYLLPFTLLTSTSFVYELIEWGAAVVFGGDLGIAYVGAQGDVWDAHKDMALAALGTVVTLGVVALASATGSSRPAG